MNTKYIFVTGGVVSGLGKGITAASLGRLLKNRGYKVTIQKFDPYINVDPGLMSPYEHGEVFVTDDGTEADLDLGHYERFIDENLTRNSSITSGRIYQSVINKELRGEYGGKTIQVIPHITNEIKEKIYSFENEDIDIVITELGGTVGDMESLAFVEAIRQVSLEKEPDDVIYIHVTLLPYISGSNEIKSKPTQHSVKELQSLGIKPDILVCRSDIAIPDGIKDKLALFCNVRKENVIANLTTDNLYAIPLMLENQGLAKQVCKHLRLDKIEPKNEKWDEMIANIRRVKDGEVTIGIVGKYVKLEDAYLSVTESLHHASFANNVKVNIKYIDCETITNENVENILSNLDGIIVPGGSGSRGINGKIVAIEYARKNNIPFLGIGLGMQLAVIEYARNVAGIKDANSVEFEERCKNPVINKMKEKIIVNNKEMRIGKYSCKLKKNTLAYEIYKQYEIGERYQHKYEFNNEYKEKLEKVGLICSGTSNDGKLVEVIEIKEHPYYIACQFHPEFKSRPDRPSPLFVGLVKAAKEKIK